MCEIPGAQELVILHVIDAKRLEYWEDRENVMVTKAENMMEEMKSSLITPGKAVKTRVAVGIPSSEILRSADEECSSLIVMAARGKSLIKGMLLGSTSSEVLRYSTTSMLLMRYKIIEGLAGDVYEKFCERTFSRILCPVKSIYDTEKTVSLIKGLPRPDRLVLLHVVDRGETKEQIEDLVKTANNRLTVIKEQLVLEGYSVDHHVHIGDPSGEINRAAEGGDVSLIVLDAREHHEAGGIRAGSITEHIARSAKRPVLVVK